MQLPVSLTPPPQPPIAPPTVAGGRSLEEIGSSRKPLPFEPIYRGAERPKTKLDTDEVGGTENLIPADLLRQRENLKSTFFIGTFKTFARIEKAATGGAVSLFTSIKRIMTTFIVSCLCICILAPPPDSGSHHGSLCCSTSERFCFINR